MEHHNPIILMGSGHLVSRVSKAITEKGLAFTRIETKRQAEPDTGLLKRELVAIGIANAHTIFILDDEDKRNIEYTLAAISLNKAAAITVSLFNEDLTPHFRKTHQNIVILNPARVSAPFFVEALYVPKKTSAETEVPREAPINNVDATRNIDWWFLGPVCAFAGLLIIGSTVFTLAEHLSFIDAFYFTTTLITTTGFGDISLYKSATGIKIFGSLLMLTSVIMASIVFSLLVDHLLRRRAEAALGRKRHRMKDHVILCGLGRVGYQVAELLLEKGEQVLVLEQDEHNRFLEIIRAKGARIFVGDAALQKNLRDAGLEYAKGLFAVINDDLKNLEIALNARALHPNMRVVVRVFDQEIAKEVSEYLKIHFATSSSAFAVTKIIARLGQR